MPEEKLLDGVLKWLEKNGFPFELHCAKAMKDAGFGVGPHGYFLDDSEGVPTPREIDLRAWKADSVTKTPDGIVHIIGMLIAGECKFSSSPWVAFVDTAMDHKAGLESYLRHQFYGMNVTENLIDDLCGVMGAPRAVVGFSRIHSSVVTMSDKGKDSAYEAAAKVLKVAECSLENVELGAHVVALPVVFVDGPLVSCELDPAGKLQLVEVDRVMVARTGFTPRTQDTTVYFPVVSRKALPEFAQNLAATHRQLLEVSRGRPEFFLHRGQDPPAAPAPYA